MPETFNTALPETLPTLMVPDPPASEPLIVSARLHRGAAAVTVRVAEDERAGVAWTNPPVPPMPVPNCVPCVEVPLLLNTSVPLFVIEPEAARAPLFAPLPSCKLPAEIVVRPVYVFVAVSTSAPVLNWVNPPAPLMGELLNCVPCVEVPLLSKTSVPPTAMEPDVAKRRRPFRCRVAGCRPRSPSGRCRCSWR